MRDADLPGFLAGLGVPGIIDIHVHAMPDRMMNAVWDFFDRAEEAYGRPWPIRYRLPDEQRREYLAAIGVTQHTTLNYAHRPGVAAGLNEWSLAYAERYPQVIPSATFFPEPGAGRYVASALDAGARVFKVHAQVGDFDVADPLLADAWGLLQDSGSTIVAHVGSGPLPGRFTGVAPVARLLGRFPRLRLVLAHCGAPETEGFLDLADRYPSIGMDTTMVGTEFMADMWPMPEALIPRLAELGAAGRLYFGSDYPNIPYEYAHQVESLVRWDLGDEWLRQVLSGAAASRILGPG